MLMESYCRGNCNCNGDCAEETPSFPVCSFQVFLPLFSLPVCSFQLFLPVFSLPVCSFHLLLPAFVCSLDLVL